MTKLSYIIFFTNGAPYGVTVDDMLKFDKQVANICRKVTLKVAVLKRMRNILPFDIRKNI